MNYVGKPLAYVLATPELPDDADNTLRVAFGNEASDRDIDEFSRRFGVRRVGRLRLDRARGDHHPRARHADRLDRQGLRRRRDLQLRDGHGVRGRGLRRERRARQRRRGHRRAGQHPGRRLLQRLLQRPVRERRADAARHVLVGRPRLPRRRRLDLPRRAHRRLDARRRREPRGRPDRADPPAAAGRQPGRGLRRAGRARRRPGDGRDRAPGRRHPLAGRARGVPRRPARPVRQGLAALRPDRARPAEHRDQQGAQARARGRGSRPPVRGCCGPARRAGRRTRRRPASRSDRRCARRRPARWYLRPGFRPGGCGCRDRVARSCSTRQPPGAARRTGASTGRRAATFRRARTLGGALGVTVLGAVLPGAGLPLDPAPARVLRAACRSSPASACSPTTRRTWHRLLDLAFDPARLRTPAVRRSASRSSSGPSSVVTTYVMARPLRDAAAREEPRRRSSSACSASWSALPAVQGVRLATTQADFVATVFDGEHTATVPEDVDRGRPVGRPRPGQRAAARRRRGSRPHRHPHRLGDPAQHEHPDRQVGDVQPAAQHDERAVPRGQPAARRLPRRLPQRGRERPGQLDAERRLQPGPGALPAHPRRLRERGRRRGEAGGGRQPRRRTSTTTC